MAIQSSTRVEWILADLGILCAGGATTTVYPSNTPPECAYILNDSATMIVFAEDDEQVAKLTAERANLKAVKHVVVFDGTASDDGWVLTLADLEARGVEHDAKDSAAYEKNIAELNKDHLATLILYLGHDRAT